MAFVHRLHDDTLYLKLASADRRGHAVISAQVRSVAQHTRCMPKAPSGLAVVGICNRWLGNCTYSARYCELHLVLYELYCVNDWRVTITTWPVLSVVLSKYLNLYFILISL